MTNITKTRLKWLALYSGSFTIISVLIFLPFLREGRSLVWGSDGFDLYLNTLAYWGMYLRAVIFNFFETGRIVFPMFDFSLGLGADILGTLHYYVIGDPLNFLAVLVPVRHTEALYIFLIFLRLYLIGLGFYAYCRYMNKPRYSALVGALVYAFCGFAILYAVRGPFFLNPLIYLPFLTIGIEKIFKGEKPYLFILMVFVSAVSSIYMFYKLTLLIVIYAAFRFFMLYKTDIAKNLLKNFGRFSAYFFCGLAMAGIIFLPATMYLLSTSRANVGLSTQFFYSFGYYEIFPIHFLALTETYGANHMAYAPIALVAIVFLFCKRNENTAMKAAFLMLTAFLMLPIMGRVFNGFSYPSNRWIFGYSFLIALITVQMIPDILTATMKKLIALLAVVAVYISWAAFVILNMYNDPYTSLLENQAPATLSGVLLGFFGLVFTVIITYVFHKVPRSETSTKTQKALVLFVTIVGIGLQGSLYGSSFFGWNRTIEYPRAGHAMDYLLNNAASAVRDLGDEEFYRLEHNLHPPVDEGIVFWSNQSLLVRENATSFYWSKMSPYVTAFYFNDMQIASYVDFRCDSLDGRAGLLALSSVRYFVSHGDTAPYGFVPITDSDENINIFRSRYALPLGYTFDRIISRETYENMSAIEKQQAILQGAVVCGDISIGTVYPVFSHRAIPFEITEDSAVTHESGEFIVPRHRDSLEIVFEALPGSETYISLRNIQIIEEMRRHSGTPRSITVARGGFGRRFFYWSPYSLRYTGQHDFLINLGYLPEGLTRATITFAIPGIYAFDLYVYSLPMANFSEQIDRLREVVLENVCMGEGNLVGTNRISGTIETRQSRLLKFSIPFSTGWRAYINGERTQVYNINTMFAGIYVPPGVHEIVLIYRTPHIVAGAIMTFAGFLAFFVMVWLRKTKTNPLNI